MITGFNTDIEYQGVTYHVQTEDKGLSKPVILSLVYDRGTILASKRASYDDMLGPDFNERALTERLHKQHRLICAAIKAGRIEDLKQMTARESAGAKQAEARSAAPVPMPAFEAMDFPFVAPLETFSGERKSAFKSDPFKDSPFTSDFPSVPPPEDLLSISGDFREAKTSILPPISVFRQELKDSLENENPIPKPFFESVFDLPDAIFAEPITDGVHVIEDEIVLPAEAVAIINEPAPQRPVNNKLSIEILGDIRFRGGERNTVGFMVSRGTSRKVVSGAQIMVKILGSAFRPVIFHAATDSNGVASVNLQLPNFTSGRAAFLVRAMSDGEEIELRRSIEHG